MELASFSFDLLDHVQFRYSVAKKKNLGYTASRFSFGPERVHLIFSSMESALRRFCVDLVNIFVQEMIGSPFTQTSK